MPNLGEKTPKSFVANSGNTSLTYVVLLISMFVAGIMVCTLISLAKLKSPVSCFTHSFRADVVEGYIWLALPVSILTSIALNVTKNEHPYLTSGIVGVVGAVILAIIGMLYGKQLLKDEDEK